MEYTPMFALGMSLVMSALLAALMPQHHKCTKCGKKIKTEADVLAHHHTTLTPSLTPDEAPELYALLR